MTDKYLLPEAERHFERLVELPPAEQRRALDALVAQDPALASLVERLLATDASDNSFLESPAIDLGAVAGTAGAVTSGKTTSELPTRIGSYLVVGQIGEGGMGTVYEAWQETPRRRVAVKVIRPGLVGSQVLARFQRESELLGKLSHPGVAAVHEAGVGDVEYASGVARSQPFYAMELVSGLPLLDYCSQKGSSQRQRLEILTQVCDAVEHAHQAGIVHRDLKPGNILVENDGRPKVLDFGVARAIADDATQNTVTGQIIGTVPYMSPEQISADRSAIDARSDVYALGVIMFELLAGRLPYELRNKSLPEAARIIRDTEPTRLSSASTQLRGDLDTIVSKALEKDPAQRYQSAAELGGDIRRHLTDQPVLARPASTFCQFRKFARRNKALVGGVCATIVVLAGGVVATSVALAREAEQRKLATDNFNLASAREKQAREAQSLAEQREAEAQRARRRAEQSAEFSKSILSAISPASSYGRDTTLLRETLAKATQRVSTTLGDDAELQADMLATIGETYRNVAAFEDALPALQSSLELWRASRGADDPLTLQATVTLAEALRLAGRAQESQPLIRGSVESLRKASPGDPSALSRHLRTVGDTAIDLGQFEEAQKLLVEAIDVASAANDRGALGDARASLGGLKRRLGKYDEARALLMLALDDAKSQSPGNEIQIGGLYNSLAIVARTTNRIDEAESMYREALRVRRNLYDRPHPDVAVVLLNLGKLYSDLGRVAEAEPLLRESVDMHRAIYPGDHQGTAIAMDRLAQLLQFKGQTDESLPMLLESQRMLKSVLGPDHPFIATSMSTLGNAYLEIGRLAESEQQLRGALDMIGRTMKSQSDAFRGPILALLGECYRRQQRYQESLDTLLEAMAVYDRLKVPDTPETGWLLSRISQTYIGLGKYEESLDYADRAIASLTKSGDTLRGALATASSADALVALGQFAKARERLDTAAAVGAEHSTFRERLEAEVARGYANLYGALAKAEPGKGYEEQARQWHEKASQSKADGPSPQAAPAGR